MLPAREGDVPPPRRSARQLQTSQMCAVWQEGIVTWDNKRTESWRYLIYLAGVADALHRCNAQQSTRGSPGLPLQGRACASTEQGQNQLSEQRRCTPFYHLPVPGGGSEEEGEAETAGRSVSGGEQCERKKNTHNPPCFPSCILAKRSHDAYLGQPLPWKHRTLLTTEDADPSVINGICSFHLDS